MNRLQSILSHLCFILSLMLVTLLIVDRFNPSMDFINNDLCKLLILVLCVGSAVLSVLHLLRSHRNR